MALPPNTNVYSPSDRPSDTVVFVTHFLEVEVAKLGDKKKQQQLPIGDERQQKSKLLNPATPPLTTTE